VSAVWGLIVGGGDEEEEEEDEVERAVCQSCNHDRETSSIFAFLLFLLRSYHDPPMHAATRFVVACDDAVQAQDGTRSEETMVPVCLFTA